MASSVRFVMASKLAQRCLTDRDPSVRSSRKRNPDARRDADPEESTRCGFRRIHEMRIPENLRDADSGEARGASSRAYLATCASGCECTCRCPNHSTRCCTCAPIWAMGMQPAYAHGHGHERRTWVLSWVRRCCMESACVHSGGKLGTVDPSSLSLAYLGPGSGSGLGPGLGFGFGW